MEENKTSTTFSVEKEVWQKFKKTVTRDKTLKEAVADLVREKVKRLDEKHEETKI